jgi:hypothetical protein
MGESGQAKERKRKEIEGGCNRREERGGNAEAVSQRVDDPRNGNAVASADLSNTLNSRDTHSLQSLAHMVQHSLIIVCCVVLPGWKLRSGLLYMDCSGGSRVRS